MNYAKFVDETIERYAQSPALSDGTTSLSYEEFGRETERVAGALHALGLEDGDAILLYSENRIEHLVMLVAAARLGLIFAPIHHAFRARELVYALRNAEPKVTFVEPSLLPELMSAMSSAGLERTPTVVTFDESSTEHLTYSHFLEASQPVETIEIDPDHPLLLTYTSGTTSMPKPVLRSHGGERWSAITYGKGWNFQHGDRVLVAMSLAWVYGICSQSQSALASGASIRILPRFHPVRVLELVERERITTFAGSVSMYPILLDVLDEQPFDISSLTKIFGGAEPRNEVAIARTEERFGQRLYEAYAMAECFPILLLTPPSDAEAPSTSIGRPPTPDAEIRLVDANGRDVAAGEVGEAWVRNPGRMLEYYREPELTAQRITEDGWIRTGDLLRRAADGQYCFEGRQTDVIIRGGTNISPLEIESVLMEHPGVRDAVVTGVPHETKGEDIVAGVVLHTADAVTPQDLLDFVARNLSAYKVPQQIVILHETPTGATGKKNRNALKAIVAQPGT
jgi:acyl-coenzyme A synthetase/AMP-(fatty) acid ligase